MGSSASEDDHMSDDSNEKKTGKKGTKAAPKNDKKAAEVKKEAAKQVQSQTVSLKQSILLKCDIYSYFETGGEGELR